MKKKIAALAVLIAGVVLLTAAIFPPDNNNITGLKSMFAAVDTISGIPDTMFAAMRQNGMVEGVSANIPAGPFIGDSVCDTANTGTYARRYVQRDVSGNVVITADYTLDPVKGTILMNPYHFTSRLGITAPVNAATSMKIVYDYTDADAKRFTIWCKDLTSGGPHPRSIWVDVTKNAAGEYWICSTMISDPQTFVSPNNEPSFNYNVTLFKAKVAANGDAVIYADKANDSSDANIVDPADFSDSSGPLSSAGPWPIPFYFIGGSTLVVTTNLPVGAITSTDKTDAASLPACKSSGSIGSW